MAYTYIILVTLAFYINRSLLAIWQTSKFRTKYFNIFKMKILLMITILLNIVKIPIGSEIRNYVEICMYNYQRMSRYLGKWVTV